MRAIWKGAVSFGLVNVPVRLYSATENHDLSFHQVRASDGSRIRYKRVAQADGEEVAYRDIAKAYETADGRTVVLTDDDFASLPNRSSKEIAVDRFVPAAQIDPILFDKAYFIEPDAMGAKAYGLLRESLRESERVAIVTVSVRSRMTMAVLRVMEEVIVLQTLLWPDEIRDSGQLDHLEEVSEPKDNEIAMARMLVDSMAGDFEPEGHEDDYQQAVEALVQSKIEGGEVSEPAQDTDEEDGAEVVDLLAALQRSVDRAKASRGEKAPATGSDGDGSKDTTSTTGTSPAKKTTKKAAAKKTTAKKPAASKGSRAKSSADEEPADRTG